MAAILPLVRNTSSRCTAARLFDEQYERISAQRTVALDATWRARTLASVHDPMRRHGMLTGYMLRASDTLGRAVVIRTNFGNVFVFERHRTGDRYPTYWCWGPREYTTLAYNSGLENPDDLPHTALQYFFGAGYDQRNVGLRQRRVWTIAPCPPRRQ